MIFWYNDLFCIFAMKKYYFSHLKKILSLKSLSTGGAYNTLCRTNALHCFSWVRFTCLRLWSCGSSWRELLLLFLTSVHMFQRVCECLSSIITRGPEWRGRMILKRNNVKNVPVAGVHKSSGRGNNPPQSAIFIYLFIYLFYGGSRFCKKLFHNALSQYVLTDVSWKRFKWYVHPINL